MLKVGLIGCGGIGKVHARCYNAMQDVELAAIADLVPENREHMVRTYRCEAYETGEELIKNADLDIIDICLPTYLHTSHAVMAMEKGRNVFVEKPVCLNENEAKLLLETEKRTGAKVQVGQVMRFWEEYRWLKDIIDSKKYGEVVSGIFTRLSTFPKWSWENWYGDGEKSGGMTLDLHIHDVDFVRYILGEPKKITSNAVKNSEGVIQQIFSAFEYDKALIALEGCWDYPDNFPFSMSYRVKFENATAVFDSESNPKLVVYKRDGKVIPELECKYDDDDIEINISSLGAYYTELKYFTDKLLLNETPEVATLQEAVNSVRLALEEIKMVSGVESND